MTQPETHPLTLAGARIELWPYKIRSEYPDGTVSEFWPMSGDLEQMRAGSACTGYGEDLMRFGLAHDLMHHYVAVTLLQQPCSRVVYGDAHGLLEWYAREDEERSWPDRMTDEEHMVNTTLRMLNTGERTDPIGHLETLTDDLGAYLEGARQLLMGAGLLPAQDVGA